MVAAKPFGFAQGGCLQSAANALITVCCGNGKGHHSKTGFYVGHIIGDAVQTAVHKRFHPGIIQVVNIKAAMNNGIQIDFAQFERVVLPVVVGELPLSGRDVRFRAG